MFVEQPQNEEDKNKQVNIPTVGGGGGGLTPTAGNLTPATGNVSTISPVQSPQPVQKWATAQDYLQANQPQAAGLGQKVQESLTGTLGTEKSAIDTGAEQAKSDIFSGTTPYNESLVNEAKTNPTAVANDQGKLQDFLKQWNASYTGPSTFESSSSYAPASAAATEATTKAGELTSSGGREQLIGDQFGVYGAGNKGLDQAILQWAPQYEQIQQLAPQFKSVQDYLTQKSGEVSNAATAAQAASDAAKTQTQGAFANNLTDFQNKINTETQGAQQKAQTIADKYNVDLTSGDPNLIGADLKEAGASDADIKQVTDLISALYGYNNVTGFTGQINPTQVTSFNPAVDINAANIATPEEYANAAALQKLTGVDYTGVLNPANATQAGTAPTGYGARNAQTLQQYLSPMVQQRDKEFLTRFDDPTWNGNPEAINKLAGGKTAQDGANLAQQYAGALTRTGATPDQVKQRMQAFLAIPEPKSGDPDMHTETYQGFLNWINTNLK